MSQERDKNTTKRICNLLTYTETSEGGIFWKQWTETGMKNILSFIAQMVVD